MPKAEFLQLAHVYNPDKHYLKDKLLSEKLDGQRAFWDGGISRGKNKKDIPWANLDRDASNHITTGLWSRHGNVIHAPDWFLDKLPPILLDLELYLGRNQFQELRKIVARFVPNDRWEKVKPIVLDSPPAKTIFADRKINTTNFKKEFIGCYHWFISNNKNIKYVDPKTTFQDRLVFISNYIQYHPQIRLSNHIDIKYFINEELKQIIANKGEGLILKSRNSLYQCCRTHDVLKVKQKLDAEATVIGYYWGDVSDNTRTVSGNAQNKLLGLMGSLLVEFNGKQFRLSGFTEDERKLTWNENSQKAWPTSLVGLNHPGTLVQSDIENKNFPRGCKVTFSYRELSDDGIPKEARYMRRYYD